MEISEKDVDKVANLIENYSHAGRLMNRFKQVNSIGESPKKFTR